MTRTQGIAFFLFIAMTVALPVSASAQDTVASPSGSAASESACRVSPRSAAAAALPSGTPRVALSLPINGTPVTLIDGLRSVRIEQLPAGQPVDAGTIAALDRFVAQVVACSAPEGPMIVLATGEPSTAATPLGSPATGLPITGLGFDPVLALYSDDYFRRVSTTAAGGLTLWAVPAGAAPVVRDVRILPDGRIGAVVELADVPSVFLVFVRSSQGFLIDELAVPTGSAATPEP